MGTLNNGGLGSPTQLMLDLEIRRVEWMYRHEIPVDDEALNFDEVLTVCREKGSFLTSAHTLSHFRELWNSPGFLSDAPIVGAWDGSEKAILDQCEEMWRSNLESWEPPAWPEGQKKAMDDLVARASRDFVGGALAARPPGSRAPS